MALLEFSNVTHVFEEPILEKVDFKIDAGEVVGLLGRNGVGKTTLLRLALGVLEPTDGDVRVFGESPTSNPIATKRRIGFAPERPDFPPHLTTSAILGLHAQLYPTFRRDLAESLFLRFDLSPYAIAASMSTGEQRRFALVCAVAHRPELLLLDEPASGLDPAARREFLEIAIELTSESDTAILFSSHHMSDVEHIAERLLIVGHKKLLLDSSISDVTERLRVAHFELASDEGLEALRRLPDCVAARRARNGGTTAVFSGQENEFREKLNAHSAKDITTVSVPLEELFIELTA